MNAAASPSVTGSPPAIVTAHGLQLAQRLGDLDPSGSSPGRHGLRLRRAHRLERGVGGRRHRTPPQRQQHPVPAHHVRPVPAPRRVVAPPLDLLDQRKQLLRNPPPRGPPSKAWPRRARVSARVEEPPSTSRGDLHGIRPPARRARHRNPSESSSMIRSSLLVLSGSGRDTISIDASVLPLLMRMSTGLSRP